MMSTSEKDQLVKDWNQTNIIFPDKRSILQHFHELVKTRGNDKALLYKGKSLTLMQVDEGSNQLAYYLLSLGVVKETPIGICLERSSDMVIALLAILKAGGAWVPLDPNYPVSRIQFMVDDADLKTIISSSRWELLFEQAFSKRNRILLDKDQALIGLLL